MNPRNVQPRSREPFPWRVLVTALLLHGLLVSWVAAQQRQPGYTDAAYYAVLGRQLAQGQGLSEPFLWIYLDHPQLPPRPGHGYWMPLVSLLAALGYVSTAWMLDAYRAVQGPFLLLALAVPVVTGMLAHGLIGRASITRWALVLSLTSGFFLPYLTAVDAFALLMLLGSLWLLALPVACRGLGAAVGLGLLTGLIHLARNEGPLWLLAAGVWLLWQAPLEKRWKLLGAVVTGYLSVMVPWWWRNVSFWGSPWPFPITRLLWLTHYNDLFLYPPELLTPQRWWEAGLQVWLEERWRALSTNLQTLLAVQGGIAGFPWMLWGWWRMRHQPQLRVATGLWLSWFLLFTLLLPGVGMRGAFFHAVAGLQPLAWVLVGIGLEAFFAWGESRRNWHPRQAHWVLGGGIWLLLLALTLGVTVARLRSWNATGGQYAALAPLLDRWAPRNCPVLLNDPPSWAWVNPHRPALVVPSGGITALRLVTQHYQACALLLEPNHPPELAHWYTQPRSLPPFRYLVEWNGIRVFLVEEQTRSLPVNEDGGAVKGTAVSARK